MVNFLTEIRYNKYCFIIYFKLMKQMAKFLMEIYEMTEKASFDNLDKNIKKSENSQ